MSDAIVQKREPIRHVNVLTLILITICACAVSFLSSNSWLHIGFVVLLLLLMLTFGFAKTGLKFLIVYLVSYAWLTVNMTYGVNFPSPMMFSLIVEMIPVLMAAYLLMQAPSGKLTSGLRKLPIPTKMLLTIIVVLRFMPTVMAEFSDVKDAMRTRGFLRSPIRVLLHPLTTFEYVAVPMIFRSLKIADELASSCVVRGIESPCKKQGYYLNRMAVSDGMLMVTFLAITAVCVGL